MYAYISGILEELESQQVVIEANGVGYRIFVPGSILQRLPSVGERTKLYTYLNVREDAQELYGFLEKEEKQFFEKLITVTGIGPKVALGMLSVHSVHQLAAAIATGDRQTLCRAPGVGKKTAERIILELQDKIDKDVFQLPDARAGISNRWTNEHVEALEALQTLGYSAIEAERALTGLKEKDSSSLIRVALKNLSNHKK
ncbi:MAG: Holliday junction branch migration protein RuvA [Clostridia bacterium]|nr:Holliday junction branch migration protein RuvA [Clostridia bacterium]MDD4680358.1 Holliday junction branch migration protein RuvA [Clostridia bacterium]